MTERDNTPRGKSGLRGVDGPRGVDHKDGPKGIEGRPGPTGRILDEKKDD